MSNDDDLQKAITVEGFLGKQRPGAFHVYQERYCRFLDGGLTLAYASSREDFDHNKIKSQIALKDVKDIVSDAKPKKFQLDLGERVYKFQAPSVEDKNKWVRAIKICKAHAVEVEEKNREQLLEFGEDVRYVQDMENEKRSNPFGVIAGGVTNVFTGVVKEVFVNTVKKGVDAVGNVILDKSAKTNDEYLKAKKLSEGLERIDSKFLQSRLQIGFLLKETKEATGVKIVDSFINDSGFRETIAKRWCLLISSKPILLDQVDPEDEMTIEKGKFPSEIEQEVLYIYDETCDNSKPLESVQLKDIIDIVIKNKNTEEQYYRFVLDLGDKKINLLTTNAVERTKWVKAIQVAKANVKEKSRSKFPVVKNLFWHLRIFAEGEQKFRAKVSHDYDKITNNGEVMGANNVKDMLKVQERVAAEFLSVINACLAHKDQKIDMIRIYVEIFHEAILSAIRSFFRRNQDNFENRDIYDIIKFLIWYRERLRIFGNAFTDNRIFVGLGTLSKIVGTRMLKTQMRTIRNIIKQELEKEPEIDGRGKAATTAPNEIFKILNETFNTLSLCNTREVAFALLETCGHILEFCQNGLTCIIDHPTVTIDQLAAFCNNCLVYINSLREFTKQAEQIIGTDKVGLAPFFDEEIYKKAFVPLGKRAQEKIAHIIFAPVCEEWTTAPFLDIKLDSMLADPIEKMNQLTEKVSGTLTIKIESACLEKVVTFYVQAFLSNAEKREFRMDELSRITQKFEDDMGLLGDLFGNLKKAVVETCISPISNFLDFLTANHSLLPIAVQSMKETYGFAIKWSTIELLIALRSDRFDKNERSDLLRSCEDIYKTTQKKAEKAKNFNVFKHLDQNFDAGTAASSTQGIDSKMASFAEEEEISEKNSSTQGDTKKSAAALNLEGYLDVEKDEFLSNVTGTLLSNLKFETKYFNLKRDILYFYKDKNSEFSQGSYKLKEMSGFGKTENEDCGFYLTVKTKDGETKTVRFKAATPDKRDVWLDFIKEAGGLPDYGGMIELNTDIQLYKDTRPLFADIEEMPNLEFTFTTNPNAANAGEKNNRRKKSFHLDEPIPKQVDETEETSLVEAKPKQTKVEEEKNCLTCAMF